MFFKCYYCSTLTCYIKSFKNVFLAKKKTKAEKRRTVCVHVYEMCLENAYDIAREQKNKEKSLR